MAWSEEDDDSQNFRYEDAKSRRGGGQRDDSWDKEGPSDADLVPDDMGTIRCGHCKKLIFEDSVRCPYCKYLQLEEEQNKKPRWLFITAIVVLIAFGGYLITTLFDILHWFHR